MKTQRFLVALCFMNLALFAVIATQWRTAQAQSREVPSVLRAQKLEIVDAQGRVRAAIQVLPSGPARRADGSSEGGRIYPETVILRLIDTNGRPIVKIAGSHDGASLSFVGEADETNVILKAEGEESSLQLNQKAGRHRTVKP
jgi:hypothetical protein